MDIPEKTEHTTENQGQGLILFVCDRRACDQCSPGCIRTPDPRHAYNFEVDSRGNLVERPMPAPEV